MKFKKKDLMPEANIHKLGVDMNTCIETALEETSKEEVKGTILIFFALQHWTKE